MTRDDLGGGTVVIVGDSEPTPPDEARISPLDRGFLYGDAVFETLRSYDGEPAFLRKHTQRLDSSLDALGIPASSDSLDVEGRVRELVDAVGGDVAERGSTEGQTPSGDAYVRVSVTRGDRDGLLAPTETSPTFVGVAKPLSRRRYEPATAEVVETRRPSVLSGMKTHNYLPNVLAKSETEADEALMRDSDGDLASGAVSNLFTLEDGVLTTPRENVRKGVTREVVLELAREMGVETRVGELSLRRADAVFLTNSTWGVRSVSEVVTGDETLTFDADGTVCRLRDAYLERATSSSSQD